MIRRKIRQLYRQSQYYFRSSHIIQSDIPCSLLTSPILYRGYNSSDHQKAIDQLQTALKERKLLVHCSGEFDKTTELAVKRFQRRNRLKDDGIVGPLTWAALFYPTLSIDQPNTDHAEKIEQLQELLCQEKLEVSLSGQFDQTTRKALKRFQKRYGLQADGICGPMTWSVLLGQRPNKRADSRLSLLIRETIFYLEQVLMITFTFLGILANPLQLDQELSLVAMLAVAYGLTYAMQPMFKRFPEMLVKQNFLLLRYAPYLLIGFVWKPVLQGFNVWVLK